MSGANNILAKKAKPLHDGTVISDVRAVFDGRKLSLRDLSEGLIENDRIDHAVKKFEHIFRQADKQAIDSEGHDLRLTLLCMAAEDEDFHLIGSCNAGQSHHGDKLADIQRFGDDTVIIRPKVIGSIDSRLIKHRARLAQQGRSKLFLKSWTCDGGVTWCDFTLHAKSNKIRAFIDQS